MWLGPKHGYLTDWTTRLWVKTTGIRTDLQSSPWLEGPIARPTGIGIHFFDDFAAERGLSVQSGTGLIKNLAELSGPGFKVGEISPAVRHFYESTTDYDLDAWSEWCGFFRPFGYVLARVFSHRLRQLNVPLSSLDTSRGISSRVADLTDAEGIFSCNCVVGCVSAGFNGTSCDGLCRAAGPHLRWHHAPVDQNGQQWGVRFSRRVSVGRIQALFAKG